MAQTGDPTGKGDQGESIYGILNGPSQRYFNAEINPKLKHKKKGMVSMAVAQDASIESGGVSGSQFFITLADDLDYLDGKYTLFGEVAEGFEVLDKMNEAFCDEKGRPFRDIRIKHTVVLDDPFPDPEGLQVPDESPLPTKEQMESMRIADDEDLEEIGDPEEIEKRAREREAKAHALTLEMIGDLPFAEVKPPENVLFVCKLNPVTRDEDLQMIFSRFGPIHSCEIIRDRQTGDSLSYAFVEFENKEDAEEVYSMGYVRYEKYQLTQFLTSIRRISRCNQCLLMTVESTSISHNQFPSCTKIGYLSELEIRNPWADLTICRRELDTERVKAVVVVKVTI